MNIDFIEYPLTELIQLPRIDFKGSVGRIFGSYRTFALKRKTKQLFLNFAAVVVSQEFVKKSKRWQQLKSKSNPPLSPFFKGGIFLGGILSPVFQRGLKS
jgi:hypothetical protein